MKHLFDQNISRKLVPRLRKEFPDFAHVAGLDLAQSTDRQIWDYAGQNDFVVVSKDSDFRQLAFLFAPPPKVVWLDVGNVNSSTILELIFHNRDSINHLSDNTEESFMLLPR